MKTTLLKTTLTLLATSLPAFSAVTWNFAAGNVTDDATGSIVATFSLVLPPGIDAFQGVAGASPSAVTINGTGNDWNSSPTVSFTLLSLSPGASLTGPITVNATELVNGAPPNPAGFAIGNNRSDLGLTFNVNGQFATAGNWVYDAASDISADGALAAGDIAVASGGVGEHDNDTFLFTPDTPIGVGTTLDVQVSSLNGSIRGEAFAFHVPLTFVVPEPSSVTLLGLSALGFVARRKR